MDFGDILFAWENQEKQADKKKTANKAAYSNKTKTVKEPLKAHPIDIWLRRYGTVDKDAAADDYIEKQNLKKPLQVKKLAIEAQIDLHGLSQEEAWRCLENFIDDCQRRGLKKVLIIHGKGNHSGDNPVLSSMVRTFIERDRRLGASGHPVAAGGGQGATWVIIRKKN